MPRPSGARLDRLRRPFPGRDAGKVDLERRAVPGLAVDPDVPAALLDDAVHGRQPEPGALAGRLGREERLERVLRTVGVHAAAGVAHREHHVLARRDAG